jgi:hypothetical protein
MITTGNRFRVTALLFFAMIFIGGCGGPVSGNGLEVSDKTIFVRRGGDLQAAIDRAEPGMTIMLEQGAVYSGAFRLPKKRAGEFITIRSAALDAELPRAGERLDPVRYADKLPKINSNVRGEPAVVALGGASRYRFVAVEFGPTIGGLYDIIKLGTGEERSVEELPSHIEFDRVWIHGDPVEGQRRGIAANGRHIKVLNSYISDIKRKGDESQGIAAWATDGPIEIVNNYIEGAAENILFGGAGSALKLVPTDCIVDSNHLNKPLSWRGEEWVVKNLFEIKNGRRIRVTNNLMTNNWAMGQDGNAILFTTRADNGPATLIEDIQFSGNIVRGAGGGLNILGNEGSGGHRLTITNNYFDDIDGGKWGGAGHFMKLTAWNGLVIENNTIIQKGSITNSYGTPVRGFVFRNNIVFENEYGIKGDNMGSGQPAIDKFYPGGVVTGNVIIGGLASMYRERNSFPATAGEVGFEDPAGGDLRLRSQSRYRDAGVEGKMPGASLDRSRVGRRQ